MCTDSYGLPSKVLQILPQHDGPQKNAQFYKVYLAF